MIRKRKESNDMLNKYIHLMLITVVSSLLFTLYAMEGGGRIPIEFLIHADNAAIQLTENSFDQPEKAAPANGPHEITCECGITLRVARQRSTLKVNFGRHLWNHVEEVKNHKAVAIHDKIMKLSYCDLCQKSFAYYFIKSASVITHIFTTHKDKVEESLKPLLNGLAFNDYFNNNVRPLPEKIVHSSGLAQEPKSIQDLIAFNLIKIKDPENIPQHAIMCPKCPTYLYASEDKAALKSNFKSHLHWHAGKTEQYSESFNQIFKNGECLFCEKKFEAKTSLSTVRNHFFLEHVTENERQEILNCAGQAFEIYFENSTISNNRKRALDE